MAGQDFWNYSLSHYGRPGAAPLCLLLQDRHGADVNLVLFAFWLGSQRLAIRDSEAARQIEAAIGDWHRNAVKPLRGVRRWLKNRTFPDPDARDALRAAIQKSEIEAERLEQFVLQRLFDTASATFSISTTEEVQAVMARNALFFCQTDGEGNEADPVVAELVKLCL